MLTEAAARLTALAYHALNVRLQACGHSRTAAEHILRRHPATARMQAAYLALCDARMAAPPEPMPVAQPEECPF